MHAGILAIGLAAAAMAQDTASVPNAAVSGTVRDAVTGKPLANYSVSTFTNATWSNNAIIQTPQTKQVQSITDESGHYRIGDLPPGSYRLDARNVQTFGSSSGKRVTLSGQDLEGVDINIKLSGSISGKVVDENKEPMPGITVLLVSREYYSGVLGYFFKSQAKTDDRGEYLLTRVDPEHSYVVMVEKREQRLPAHSEAPLDPKLRRRAVMRTFYPNSTVMEGAAPITITSGERREHVDIAVKKSPNYCVEATLVGPMGPAVLDFNIEATQPAYGTSSTGGMFGLTPGGRTGPDGKLRICDLSPGSYRISAVERSVSAGAQAALGNHAIVPVTISDHDPAKMEIQLSSGPKLDGEAVWDVPPPEAPPADPDKPVTPPRLNIGLNPLLRSPLQGENGMSARVDIPGTFQFTGLTPGDYALRNFLNRGGMYIKEITLGGNSVMYQPLHVGDSMASGLRVVLARDGATINARVTNKDGLPVSGMRVWVIPANVASEGQVQMAMFGGETDQQGVFVSHTVAPGKYYVVATADWFDATPESVGRLWRSRTRFQEVDAAANGTVQVSLVPVKVD